MRLDPRMLVGVAALLVGFVVTCSLISGADTTSPYLAANADLARGTLITADDLIAIDIKFPSDQDALAWPADLELPEGALLIEPVLKGEPLLHSHVGLIAPLAVHEVAFTLPISDDATWRAVGLGDHVRIWLSGQARDPVTRAEVIFAQPLVVRARLLASRFDDDERVNVTLAVADDYINLNEIAKGLISGEHLVYRLSPESNSLDDELQRQLQAVGWTSGWLLTGVQAATTADDGGSQ